MRPGYAGILHFVKYIVAQVFAFASRAPTGDWQAGLRPADVIIVTCAGMGFVGDVGFVATDSVVCGFLRWCERNSPTAVFIAAGESTRRVRRRGPGCGLWVPGGYPQ